MTGRLAGLRAAVTGAAGTLGTALAERLLAEGCSGVFLGDLSEPAVKGLADGLAAQAGDLADAGTGGRPIVAGRFLDVTDHDAVQAFADEAAATMGGLDIMINNAGVLSPSARIHNVRPEDLRRVLDVNVVGVFNGVQAAVRHMRGTGGSIVNTASVAGMRAWTHAAPYGLSKAAVIHLTKIAAREYAAEGVRINCVCPGTFRSAIHDGLPDPALEAITARHPIGRLADVDEVVAAFVHLAGPESSFTTGAALVVDGGHAT